MEDTGIRINKFLSEAGICSRREADRQIADGQVTIDGKTAIAGDKVSPGQKVSFCGKMVHKEEKEVLLLVHKPVGIVCTTQKKEKDNVVDFINYPIRIYPVGRLDKDSSGLLLMTNQGDIVNKMMRGGNFHEKEYTVTVNKPVTAAFIDGMSAGVYLKELDVVTRKCIVRQTGKKTFCIILTQGLNRQIRRMCEGFGYHVTALKRVRIMNLELGDLKPGTYREISKVELEKLKELMLDSANETVILGKHREKQKQEGSNGGKTGKGTG